MLSNQKLQKALEEIKEISKLETVLFNGKGKRVAGTFLPDKAIEDAVEEFIDSPAEVETVGDYYFLKVMVEDEPEYILVGEAKNDNGVVLCRMASCQIRNLALSNAEQYDRNNFMQNILLGNMLTVDIFSKAKKLHIEEEDRMVFVIDTGKKNSDIAMELVKNLSNFRTGDFVTSVDEHSIVLIKSMAEAGSRDYEVFAKQIADSMVDNLQMEAMIKVRVGYGNVVRQLTKLSDSYQEAKLALEVGRVFYAEYQTISYGKLGIGRLIYQLPKSLCEMYIQEVFGEGIPEILDDEEAMTTIGKFFENNLNISETARQLYLHRNTLVYRLERIEKAIGLDIRTFEDAMTFRIAVMVIAHLKDLQGGN